MLSERLPEKEEPYRKEQRPKRRGETRIIFFIFPSRRNETFERTGIDVDSRLVRALYRKLILARSTAGYV